MNDLRPPLSVVIVTFRSRATLGAALDALIRAAPLGAELVVVENGGDDDVDEVVRAVWPTATVISSQDNVGFAVGVNAGLGLVTGDAVLLLNPDAIVEPGAIKTLLAALDALPDAGIVAPRLLDAEGQPVLSAYPFLSPLTVAWRHLQLIRLFPDAVLGRYRRATLDPDARSPVSVDWAQGACLVIRRAVLDEVGRLDPDFFLYAEEVDLAKRAARAGWKTYLVPTACVRHAEGSSSGQVVPLKLASHYLSKAVYFQKHHGKATQDAVRAILLLDLALRALYRAVGVLAGAPKDARQRLTAYLTTARLLLGTPPRHLPLAWRRLAAPVDGGAAAEAVRAQFPHPPKR
ncbi:MAG: glycosyltransferase family 2 protein [Chloroflexi bacterium]|nr:glycosyltransferase family 2 protein [Chloroflexota bacterium]